MEKRRNCIEWVEIIEPRTRDFMYANLATGECVWDPPEGVDIKRSDDNQWWELFDVNTRRFYYYNVASHTTVWHRPLNSDIIPLAKLQCLKQFSGGSGGIGDFSPAEPRRPAADNFLPPSAISQSKSKKSFSAASQGGGEFDATYENQQTLDRSGGSKCSHRKQITSGHSDSGGCRSLLRMSSASSSRPPCEGASGHDGPYGASSSDYEHRLEQDLMPSNYHPFATTSSGGGGGGVPVHSTSTPQLKKKYSGSGSSSNNNNNNQPMMGYNSSSRDGMASLKHQHYQQQQQQSSRNHSDIEHNSSASITRSGSFVSSQQQQQSKKALRSTNSRNATTRDTALMGVNSDDDSMHEKYFKSVESTPQASRRRNTAGGGGQSSSGGGGATGGTAFSHTKRSSDSSSPQSPPQGGGGATAIHQPVKVSSRSGGGGVRSAGSGLDTTTSTNRSSRSNPSRDPLVEKPEKYLDKMLLQQHREKGNNNNTNTNSNSINHPQQHQMKLPLNVESQFVSKTATITSQNNNNSMGTGTRTSTNSRISPKCVTPSGSQELMLSKTNLDRHNRDLAQCENQLKLKKRSPGNTGASAAAAAVVVVTPKAAGKGKQTKTNTYASDVDYDAGNMSPLYSNWDQQEHLLPLQHYIIEQAKLSKYSKYFGAGGGGAGGTGPPLPGDVDSVDSDSLHSDSQSEHDSFSGHEPDNEDSDHSEGRGDYLTYQHYMSEDVVGGGGLGGGDAERQNYYNVFDKNNGRGEDFRSSEAEAKLESVRDNLYSPVQNNQFFNPVMQPQPHLHQHSHQGAPQPPIHHSQSSVVDGGVHTSSRLSPMRQLQRSLQTHAPPLLPPAAPGGASSTLAALKFFNTEEYPNQPIYGTQFGVVAPLAIMKETDIEKFAQDNLNLHAKGIFRKKSSVRDMLSWTGDAISRPMLALARDKAGKKMAIELFKLVQIYMGDRKARQGMSLNSVAIDVITLGVMQPALRDELYVQLCRQTTENPSRESMIRGWELMAICLAFLSPSPTFQPALLNYMNRHHDPTFATSFPEFGKWPIHVQVSHYAKVACKRLERIGSSGKRPTKKPSEEEVNQARMQIFRDSMFGNTLDEVMQLQKERFPNRQLPWLQVMLSEQVIMMGGKETEGIFRVPADLDEIGMVKNRLDQWEIPDIPSMDAHTPACLLKLWYRELYEPLIPDDLYEESIKAEDPAQVAQIVDQLAPLNRLVLTYLIHFLQEFSQPAVVANTKMDSSNLAMVFAPNCLRCTSQDPKVIMENTRKEMSFLRTLITTMDTKHVQNML